MKKCHTSFAVTFLGIFLIWIFLAVLMRCSGENERKSAVVTGKSHPSDTLRYVGREQCRECHQREFGLWQGSDHDLAMQEASAETVLGDFNDVKLTHFGITSRFYTRDGKYFIHTEGPNGGMRDFEIKYTFGVRPLQQYLVLFPDGRLQTLPLCWDTRPAGQGGQQWFHIYPQERISPADELYWTGMNQNWNYMCAECHSTDLKKNYDRRNQTYQTSWSEIDVSCEACHGPGSRHVDWAKARENGQRADNFKNMGLVVLLKDPSLGNWIFNRETGNAVRTTPLPSRVQIETCARCHSRRTLLNENYHYGHPLLDSHLLQLLQEGYYFPDGQILEEVYVYGSFLQSKMYDRGVVCGDCHEPHSGKIYAQGNALCYRCHLHEKYGSKTHHFHNPDSTGASCVECHMPERTYMVVDPRRDHSIRNPRPDLSLKTGSPNACNKCHSEKSIQWAVDYMVKWYGTRENDPLHYGEIVQAVYQEQPGALDDLLELATDTARAPIVRATALTLLERYPVPDIQPVLIAALRDTDPLIRYGAVQAVRIYSLQDRFNLARHLLHDPILSVRIEATGLLMDVPPHTLASSEVALLNKNIREYVAVQEFNGDRAGSLLNLGRVYLQQGDPDQAEQAFLQAIEREPYFVYAYLNLADLYRGRQDESKSEAILKKGLQENPNSADLHYSLGLALVRQKRNTEALKELKSAIDLRPDDPHLNYVYAVGLNSSGAPDQAVRILEKIQRKRPTNREVLFALVTFNRDHGNTAAALEYAQKLVEYWPQEPGYLQLYREIETGSQ